MKGQVLIMKYKNVRLLFILIVAGSVVLAAVKASSVDKKSARETNRNAEAVDDNLEKL
jgi:predicted ATPase